ncbi:MAG: rhomboid family intramembrane serine protease [Acidobacteria bacterium]|nr:rhomboid family intramembrane serine protease [Acidobacteriota bacterium]
MSLEYLEKTETENDLAGEQEVPQAQVGFGTPYYTCVLIGCLILVVLVQMFAGFDLSNSRVAFDKNAFRYGDEYWRILTGMTAHGFLLHFLLNTYAFFSFGRLFEFLSSGSHLAIVFLLGGICGNVLSLLFLPDVPSVGASGGIIALVGYLAVYAFRRRQFVSPQFRKSLMMNIGFILVFGLILYDVVDNYGHIGGLLAGAVYAYFQIPSDVYKDPRETGPAAQGAGMASLGIFIAASLLSVYLIITAIN